MGPRDVETTGAAPPGTTESADQRGAAAALGLEPRIPRATYRLQFNQHFTFADALRLVPYLDGLGISDLYASSYLAARPGSLHGYDIVDHNALNPEIGDATTYERLAAALRARGMGHILDVVPNHMGIGAGANRWWNDVLENGPSSPYAEFFEIDWDPVERHLANRVLLPILGDQYGRILENQELVLELEAGAFRIRHHETVLPVEPRSTIQILSHGLDALAHAGGDASPLQEYQSIITALGNLPAVTETAPERVEERMREKEVIRRRLAQLVDSSEAVRVTLTRTVAAFNGQRGDPRSFDLLDRLLSDQPYRLAHWRVAGEEINYRRFFDVNELAAIRIENPAVLAETHRFIFRLLDEERVTGLRIDHPDGLFDPRQYFLALQRTRFAQGARARHPGDAADGGLDAAAFEARCGEDPLRPGCRPLYVVAEKILAWGERLPERWAIHGTTGYDFLNLVNGLFVDRAHARAMTSIYAAFVGQRARFADLVYESKQLIMEVSMSSELTVLGHALSRLADRTRYSRDFTRNSVTDALREVIACFPLYRTYITGEEIALQDRACVEVAVAFAKRRNPATSVSIFDFVRDVLLLRYPPDADDVYRRDQRAFVQKFQQVTGPVTAKGVEDTAFYRYHRLVSLNEVGGDPDRFGCSLEEFHERCTVRQESWPAALSATATHDAKRGEDVRARIDVLSELPRQWQEAVRRWHRWNRRHATVIDGQPAPTKNDEYLLYQTLVGAWPLGLATPEEHATFVARIQAYMAKATMEAKVNTSWVNPNQAYDEAVKSFVARVLDRGSSARFLGDFASFHAPVALLGMVTGLAQTVAKIVAPGVPDFYQGTEFWDLHLVDPDNRGPVDFAAREAALAALAPRIEAGELTALAREVLEQWRGGWIKLYTIVRALSVRRASPELFAQGAYIPLSSGGRHAGHVCSFARRHGGSAALAIVPRLTAGPTDGGARLPLGRDVWGDTWVGLPAELGGAYVDAFTGAAVAAVPREGGASLDVADLLAQFPVALMVRIG
jgi:(1->4)-alpha-D-glucan 1-alpha-D-glucosylmutase